MIQFFQTYIGYSGLLTIIGLVIAFLSYASISKGAEGEAVVNGIAGTVIGLVLVVLGSAVWFAIFMLGKV